MVRKCFPNIAEYLRHQNGTYFRPYLHRLLLGGLGRIGTEDSTTNLLKKAGKTTTWKHDPLGAEDKASFAATLALVTFWKFIWPPVQCLWNTRWSVVEDWP